MKLYYAPGACSLADHITAAEGGILVRLEKVDLKTYTTEDGHDFRAINPKGYVPALALDDGTVLTENVAILAFLGEDLRTDGLTLRLEDLADRFLPRLRQELAAAGITPPTGPRQLEDSSPRPELP